MAISINNEGFLPQETSSGSGQSGENKIAFELDEGVNRIHIAFMMPSYQSVYWVVSNAVSTSTSNYMYMPYCSRVNYAGGAADASSHSQSTTNERFYLPYSSNINTGTIWHRLDITIISLPCDGKFTPSVWYEGSTSFNVGNYEFLYYGGAKILKRTSSSERPVYFQFINNGGVDFSWKARRWTEAKILKGT